MRHPTPHRSDRPPRSSPRRRLAWLLAAAGTALLLSALLLSAPLPGHELVPAGTPRNAAHAIVTRDGVRLAADVWLPADLHPGERIPAILTVTRYWRAPAMGPLFRLRVLLGRERVPNLDLADAWNARGYALVLVDARGSGASSGSRPIEWSPAEVADTGEIIDWIARRPWSNGRVGATGVSYAGNAAELAALSRHAALRAVAPLYSDFDPLLHLAMPGGVDNAGFVEAWSAANLALDAGDVCALEGVRGPRCLAARLLVPGPKPVDGDHGGRLLRRAIDEHATLDLAAALATADHRDDLLPGSGLGVGDVSPYGRLEALEAAAVPTLVRVGWLDAATADGALARFSSSDAPQRLVIGAWSHGGLNDVDPFRPPASWPEPRREAQFDELVAFFDAHLKGDAPEDDPPRTIRYVTMNEGRWRTTTTWPPPEVAPRRLYLGAEGTLTDAPPVAAAEADRYLVDFTASSGATTRWHTNLGGGDVVYPDRRDEDAKLLTYTSAPLRRPLRLTGAPLLSLPLASTHIDGALHVYLESVAPDGRVTYLTEGILRLVHRADPGAALPYSPLDPRLPRRSFRRADAAPLVPGEVVRVELPLFSTSVRLEAGHRVRIAVAGHDASLFARYPAEGDPELTVWRSAERPAWLELPVAAADPRAEGSVR